MIQVVAEEWDDSLDVVMSWVDLRSVADLVRLAVSEAALVCRRTG